MKRRRQRLQNQTQSTSPIQGLWRDRNFLVIDLREHQFPPRCLKSNLPCDLPAESTALSTQSVTDDEGDRLDDDEELTNTAQDSYGHKSRTTVELRLRLPLRPGWRRLITSPWGTWIAGVGWFGLILSLPASLLLKLFSTWIDRRAGVGMILISLAVLLLGLFINLCLSWILPIRRIEEKKVWLGGVNRDFLRSLPEFVPSSQMLVRELEVANWKFWPALAMGFVFVILVFVTIASVTPEFLGRWVISVYLIAIGLTILFANATSGHILRTRRRLDELYLSRIRRRGRKRR
jgi:hypothetical protein